jgi:hypothetical protein
MDARPLFECHAKAGRREGEEKRRTRKTRYLKLHGAAAAALDRVEGNPFVDRSGGGVLGDGQQVAGQQIVLGEAVPIVDVQPDRVGVGVEAARVERERLA